MQVSKEEILHIANLADLEISDKDIENFIFNLQDTLNFADVINNAPIENLDITIASNEAKNVFRKDEVKEFKDNEALFVSSPEVSGHMFKVPKVL